MQMIRFGGVGSYSAPRLRVKVSFHLSVFSEPTSYCCHYHQHFKCKQMIQSYSTVHVQIITLSVMCFTDVFNVGQVLYITGCLLLQKWF